MHAGRHYSALEITRWTRREALIFLVVGGLPLALHVFGVQVPIPWAPVAVFGTAVAFMTGFKSNAAYGRLWEARQVWGAIVNQSRAWSMLTRDLLTAPDDDPVRARLIDRHIAWLTALRYQLREPRAWETAFQVHNVEYQDRMHFIVPERATPLEPELRRLLAASEVDAVLGKKNRATALLSRQSADLRACADAGHLEPNAQVALAGLITSLIEQQGKCERIKNFPYPRQFATLNLAFVWMFVLILPFAVYGELTRTAPAWTPLTVPLSALMAWVFHTMDKIGSASENPFEGGPNDVPISAMSRAIEIDLRDLQDAPLPAPLAPVGNILM